MKRKHGRKIRRRRVVKTRRFARKVLSTVARAAEKKMLILTTGTFTTPTAITNNPYLYYNPVEGITQGSGRGNRTGNRIYLRRTKWRFVVSLNIDDAATRTEVNLGFRVIIGYFKNHSYLNTSIFEDISGTTDANDRYHLPVDIDKFFVLKDKVYLANNLFYNANNISIPCWRIVKMSIKWNRGIMYNDNIVGAGSQSVLPAMIVVANHFGTAPQNRIVIHGSFISTFTDL